MSGLSGAVGGMDEESSRAFYTSDSTAYDARRWRSPDGAFTNRVQQRILARLTSQWGGGRVLEAGPGTGRFSVPVARTVASLTVVDISPGMLEVVKKNVAAEGLSAKVQGYVEGSIYALPFGDGSFDHAFSLNVFNHLERTGDALKELARVVRPGGNVLFNYANLRSYYYPAAARINKRGKAEGQDVFSSWITWGHVRDLIAKAGLTVETRVGHTHVPRSLERRGLHHPVRVLDAVSRGGVLRGLAPVQFCLCRRNGKA